MSELLGVAREQPDLLVPCDGREIGAFTVSMIRPNGLKRGAGKTGTFIDSLLGLLDDFYGEVVQNLKKWQAPPPKLRADNESGTREHENTEAIPEDSQVGVLLSDE